MLRNPFFPQLSNVERRRFLNFDRGIVLLEENGYNSLFKIPSGSIPTAYTEWLDFTRVQGGIVVITPKGQHIICILTDASAFDRAFTRPLLPEVDASCTVAAPHVRVQIVSSGGDDLRRPGKKKYPRSKSKKPSLAARRAQSERDKAAHAKKKMDTTALDVETVTAKKEKPPAALPRRQARPEGLPSQTYADVAASPPMDRRSVF